MNKPVRIFFSTAAILTLIPFSRPVCAQQDSGTNKTSATTAAAN